MPHLRHCAEDRAHAEHAGDVDVPLVPPATALLRRAHRLQARPRHRVLELAVEITKTTYKVYSFKSSFFKIIFLSHIVTYYIFFLFWDDGQCPLYGFDSIRTGKCANQFHLKPLYRTVLV